MIGHRVSRAAVCIAVLAWLSGCAQPSAHELASQASPLADEVTEGLKLAPPAPEFPPRLHIGDTEVPWFFLDWNSESLSSVVEPDIATVHRARNPTGDVVVDLSPTAIPVDFEVLVYEGEVETDAPTADPYLSLDCLNDGDPCQWVEAGGSDSIRVKGVRDGAQVLVVQARYFAPPASNPERIFNEVTWVIELE